jgi:gag-polypeptide of LTR copia-type
MADENNKLDSKPISLKSFNFTEYFSWAPHAEIAFKLNKCWDIVNGTELNPTPTPNPDGAPAAITSEIHYKIDSWEHCRNLAQEAIFKSLRSSEMAKIYDVKHDRPVIWNGLKEEYESALLVEYVAADAQLSNLRIDKSTSIKDHIDSFNRICTRMDRNRPSETPPLTPSIQNLRFITSLTEIGDKDWNIWFSAKSATLNAISTSQFFAEVRAKDARKLAIENEKNARNEAAKALATRISNANTLGRGKYLGGRGGRGGRGNYGGDYGGKRTH